ncbi:hypothetical protein LSTR_LSTR011384 [Laodelphax striatellus]|uniref:Uncharacterized protein n=1 Tax=Laodelphax striatellus TaxID=195883 RepID=A0A482X7N4_LAOST|nr:hypothetical protein LSTR_LSTR011384 [Laodelphax striatellus]
MKIPLDKMAIVNSHFGLAIQYIVCLIIGFNVQLTHSGDKNQLTGGGGGGGLLSILGGATEQAEPPSPYLRDLTGFWSYNDSTDLSKYEDFDHAKFLERPFQKVGGSAIGKPAASLTSADDDTKRQPAASADQLDQAANSLPVFDNDMTAPKLFEASQSLLSALTSHDVPHDWRRGHPLSSPHSPHQKFSSMRLFAVLTGGSLDFSRVKGEWLMSSWIGRSGLALIFRYSLTRALDAGLGGSIWLRTGSQCKGVDLREPEHNT